jgi:hypothetical protein
VPVSHPAGVAIVVSSIGRSGAPAGGSLLSATASGSERAYVTHWWSTHATAT